MADVINFDARDPLVQHPAEDAQWVESRRFRRQLASSAIVAEIAKMVRHGSDVFEGWRHNPSLPPLTIHQQAAEIAVRSCSVEVQACATSQLEQYAAATHDDLSARLRSCDATPEARVREIKRWARELVQVHTYHLRHEAGRHPLEVKQLEQEQGVLDGLD